MSRKAFAILAVLVAIGSAGCSDAPESALPGKYVLKHSYGMEWLTLNSDGTYAQEIKLSGAAAPLTNRGTWRYRDGQIALEGAIVVDDGIGHLRADLSKAVWNLPVTRGFDGKTVLGTNIDSDQRFFPEEK